MIHRPRLVLALALALVAGPASAQPCADCLEAGAARVELRLPAGTPLAGYGSPARRRLVPDLLGRHPHAFWFKSAEGTRDPLAARALVLESGGQRVAWVTIDLLAVDAAFTAEVERGLAAAGVRPATVLVSASHTHSGPGAFIDSALLGWLAVDRLDADVRRALVDAGVAAIREADAGRRPARIAVASVAVPTIVTSRLGRAVDSEMLVLKLADTGGSPLALAWNYAIHGTVLGARNLRWSADVMGEASRRLEQAVGVPALFVNGAVGDVSPARHGEAAVVALGAELAASARGGWAQAERVAHPALRVGRRTVALPGPWLSAHNCLRGWLPRAVGLPLASVFPRETTLTAVTVGDVGWVTVPGEMQTSLGRGIKDAATGLRHVLVAGLSNGYLGYLTTAADYDRPSYVSCANIYGPRTGGCLAETAVSLLGSLARGEAPAQAPATCDQ